MLKQIINKFLFSQSISFIGCGNMGTAILNGILTSGKYQKNNLFICDQDIQVQQKVKKQFNIIPQTAKQVLQKGQYILLAVKPKSVLSALNQIKPYFNIEKHVLVSIVAGFTTKTYQEIIPKAKVIRVMPNTPSKINQGISAICKGSAISNKQMNNVIDIMSSVGIVQEMDQNLIDAATGLSGCGVAYVLSFIEAMENAGVREGLPRTVARKLAIQTVLGSSQMIHEVVVQKGINNVYPAILRGEVESPGGATIAGSLALQSSGFQSSIYAAVEAATKRSRELGMKK